ncbi:MAG: hypothetical protein HKL88_06990 [Bacteroidia bacterium]|nr:hypothetical protein [Bacteroidia bacterium]
MAAGETVIIKHNKSRIFLLLCYSLCFVALAIYLWRKQDGNPFVSAWIRYAVSAVTVLFFGAGAVLAAIRLFNKTPYLTRDEKGIAFGKGQTVEWRHITGIRKTRVRRTELLLICTDNIPDMLNRQPWWKKRMMNYSIDTYGTAYSIGAGTTQYTLPELLGIIENVRVKYSNINQTDRLTLNANAKPE